MLNIDTTTSPTGYCSSNCKFKVEMCWTDSSNNGGNCATTGDIYPHTIHPFTDVSSSCVLSPKSISSYYLSIGQDGGTFSQQLCVVDYGSTGITDLFESVGGAQCL